MRLADAFEAIAAGRCRRSRGASLIAGPPPNRASCGASSSCNTVLDYSALQPGERAKRRDPSRPPGRELGADADPRLNTAHGPVPLPTRNSARSRKMRAQCHADDDGSDRVLWLAAAFSADDSGDLDQPRRRLIVTAASSPGFRHVQPDLRRIRRALCRLASTSASSSRVYRARRHGKR